MSRPRAALCEDAMIWKGSLKKQNPSPDPPLPGACPAGDHSRTQAHTSRSWSAPTGTAKRRYKQRGTRECGERINQHCYFLLLVGFPLPDALFILFRSSSSRTHHSNLGYAIPLEASGCRVVPAPRGLDNPGTTQPSPRVTLASHILPAGSGLILGIKHNSIPVSRGLTAVTQEDADGLMNGSDGERRISQQHPLGDGRGTPTTTLWTQRFHSLQSPHQFKMTSVFISQTLGLCEQLRSKVQQILNPDVNEATFHPGQNVRCCTPAGARHISVPGSQQHPDPPPYI